MEKPHEIALGGKSEENKVILEGLQMGGGCSPPTPPLFLNSKLCCFLPPAYPPCFSELQTLLLSLSPTTSRVVANATTTTTTKTVTQQQKHQQQEQK